MPGNVAIFIPVSVLAFWTFAVLILIPFMGPHGARQQAAADAAATAGSTAPAPPVNRANRNLMNLLEVPVLFYVACLVLYVTGGASHVTVLLAWIYVVLRIVHSAIHLTYNTIRHRGLVFAASNVVVVALWVAVIAHVTAAAAVY